MSTRSARFKQEVSGTFWLALEILPTGRVRRVEWVEDLQDDPALDGCLFSTIRRWRFPAHNRRTIGDVTFTVAGINSF